MSEGKMRNRSQISGEKAVQIIRSMFPVEWVVRDYIPDYGIDLAVELFEEYKDNYITTGEHLYFQIKGTEELKKGKLKVYERSNVEKMYTKKELYKEIEVVKFKIETALLGTVEKMGSAVPVILVVVDITNKTAYFVCLNDYIEKIIIPNNPNYTEQETIVINIPISNRIINDKDLIPVNWYAKRAKLYALFNKANYQNSELEYMEDDNLSKGILHFARIIRRLDAWSASKYFPALKIVQDELDFFLKNGTPIMSEKVIDHFRNNGKDINEKCWETKYSTGKLSFIECQNAMNLRDVWKRICNCGFLLEDLSKEWFLPTFMGSITSGK